MLCSGQSNVMDGSNMRCPACRFRALATRLLKKVRTPMVLCDSENVFSIRQWIYHYRSPGRVFLAHARAICHCCRQVFWSFGRFASSIGAILFRACQYHYLALNQHQLTSRTCRIRLDSLGANRGRPGLPWPSERSHHPKPSCFYLSFIS